MTSSLMGTNGLGLGSLAASPSHGTEVVGASGECESDGWDVDMAGATCEVADDEEERGSSSCAPQGRGEVTTIETA